MLDVIKKLCKERGISINDLEEALGYSNSTLYRLKRQNAGADKVKAIADYFDVSTDYLLGRTEQKKKNDVTDLNEALDSMLSFDGEPMTKNDREVIKAYLEGRFGKK